MSSGLLADRAFIRDSCSNGRLAAPVGAAFGKKAVYNA